MDNLTLMVLSCDAYEDLWYPFFTLLKKNWGSIKLPIVLNTETKEYNDTNLKIESFKVCQGAKRPKNWSERLLLNLKKVQTDFVLFLIDDFFLQSPVDDTKIEQCLEWIGKDNNVVCFNFFGLSGGKGESVKYKGFEQVGNKAKYRVNLQAAIWRKDYLLKYIRRHESPWYFETWGNYRSRRLKGEIYTRLKNQPPIFDYDVFLGVTQGKWMNEKTKDFFKDNNIDLDLEKRGFLEERDYVSKKRKPLLKKIIDVLRSLV